MRILAAEPPGAEKPPILPPAAKTLWQGESSRKALVPKELPAPARFVVDSPLEGGGFEPPVPRQRRHPSAPANHLSSYHFPRKLGLRFAPKASTPSRKSSELRRPVFKIEPKPRWQRMTFSLPANRRTGHVILGLDRLTSHAAQMDGLIFLV